MKKKSGVIWLGAGLIMAVLAAVLTFRLLNDAVPTASVSAEGAETVAAVVAARDVPVRAILTSEDILVRQVPVDVVPVGIAATLDQVLGKVSTVDLVAGEWVMVDRLADLDMKGSNMLYTMPEDQVLVALPAVDLMSQTGLLQAGDMVDILYSIDLEGGGGMSTGGSSMVALAALQNQEIQAIVVADLAAGADPANSGISQYSSTIAEGEAAVLVAVELQDALVLKYLQDAGGVLSFALRAPTNQQLMETETVSMDYLADRYQIELETTDAAFMQSAFELMMSGEEPTEAPNDQEVWFIEAGLSIGRV